MTNSQIATPEACKALFEKATQAAQDATKDGRDDLPCGFAWVTVKPASGPFINWCKKNSLGSNAYKGGWQFWSPVSWLGQNVHVQEQGAKAFAKVLVEAGLNAVADSRWD